MAAVILSVSDQSIYKGEMLAYKAFRDNFLHKCGDPKDPVEVMLFEQLLMAQMAIGNLHLKVGRITDATALGIVTSAIARLSAEFRKTALGIQQYKTPVPPAVTFVQQQNVGAEQQIAYLAKPNGQETADKKTSNTELQIEPAGALTHEELPELFAKHDPSSREPEETFHAQRLHNRGTRETAARRSAASALATRNGSAIRGRQGPSSGQRQAPSNGSAFSARIEG